jgi:hypothetical protein
LVLEKIVGFEGECKKASTFLKVRFLKHFKQKLRK